VRSNIHFQVSLAEGVLGESGLQLLPNHISKLDYVSFRACNLCSKWCGEGVGVLPWNRLGRL
jgi:hypothetical protein